MKTVETAAANESAPNTTKTVMATVK